MILCIFRANHFKCHMAVLTFNQEKKYRQYFLKEAIISNGVVRLSLQSPNWVSAILSMENKIVVLNENSKDYDIYYAVKKLEDGYEDKVKECQMFQ